MIRNCEVAAELGYLRLPRSFMTDNDRWQGLAPDHLMFLTTGSKASHVGPAPGRAE
jgi:hypothetical protein